ncbi:MAG: endonuclease [Candidatus Cloacimonetes bacterium]|nr:endonuclease [Candidatus Cloacimonadota bacterium]
MKTDTTKRLQEIFELLCAEHGRRNKWWSESIDEIIIGAILTQNTNWLNVEKSLTNLRAAEKLGMVALAKADAVEIAELIRPSGYHNKKSRVLIDVSQAISNYQGTYNTADFRHWLLSLKGIGPETADSILLYGYRLPIFVIDAYTIRIFSRLGLCSAKISYHELQHWFMQHLLPDTDLYREYHALLISHAKAFCLKKPKCAACPLVAICCYRKDLARQAR